MKLKLITALCAMGMVYVSVAQIKAASSSSTGNVREPSLEPVSDEPGLPRVLLIGDSISMGYTIPVRTLLKGKANVHRIPENGGPTTNGVAKLHSWLGNSHWDVIHFNWGLHDLRIMSDGRQQVSLEDYEKNLRQLVRELKSTKAKLIWASTTPVPEGVTNPVRHSEDVLKYNAIAKQIMEAERVEIDDLYGFALPQLAKIQRPANVHFTDEGSEVLARKVAASIERVLKQSKDHRTQNKPASK